MYEHIFRYLSVSDSGLIMLNCLLRNTFSWSELHFVYDFLKKERKVMVGIVLQIYLKSCAMWKHLDGCNRKVFLDMSWIMLEVSVKSFCQCCYL